MYGATAGQVGILDIESSTNQAICGILPNKKIDPKYLYYYLLQQTNEFLDIRTGVARPNLSQDKIKSFKVSLISIESQNQIVSEIEKIEDKINIIKEDNKQLKIDGEAILVKYLR